MKKDKLNRFSVSLGLLDYVNPIFYAITIYTIISNIYPLLQAPYNYILLIGAIISLFFGFIIPTGKVLVGLGIIKFRMPVSLVFCVNSGILLSGLMLLKYVMNISLTTLIVIAAFIIITLIWIYLKSKKINTIAVLTWAFWYLLMYISLITLAIKNNIVLPVILYGIAILLFVMLCGIGIKADLKNPKVHWVIEISNVVCQGLVAFATIILFFQI